ncbi:MAG: hypothetical protein PHU03_07225, partial [Syntrophales bacterium]|nr:hypothetical protein [Syntrophales bacterium]
MTLSRPFKIVLNLLIILVWGWSLFFLMKREGMLAPPDEQPSFNRFLATEFEIDSWRSIYVDGRWIGYVHFLYGPREEEGFAATSTSFLKFNMFGQPRELAIESRQLLDNDHRLLEFETTISGIAGITIRGRRVDKRLIASIAYGDVAMQRSFDFDDNFFLDHGIFQVYRGTGLSPGDTWRLNVLNPMTFKPESVILRVIDRENDLLVMETQFAGLTATSWVDKGGLVVREETPNGWTIVSEPREKVERHLEASSFAAVDILEQVSVPVAKKLPSPRSIRSLILRVSGYDAGKIPFNEARQILLDLEEGIIRITAENEASIAGMTMPFEDESIRPYL